MCHLFARRSWFGGSEGGSQAQGFLRYPEAMDHMVYNFKIQLMKVCVSRQRGAGFRHRLQEKSERGVVGSVAHQITLGRYRTASLMPRVKRGNFVLERG